MKTPRKQQTGNGDILERAKRELERMIDLAPQVMLLVRRDGTIVRANRAFLELTGQNDFRNVLHRKLSQVIPLSDPSVVDELLVRRAGHETRDITWKSRGGVERPLRLTHIASPESSSPSVFVIQDTSEEKERAGRVEITIRKKAVRELVGGLMHTLNQPLTVMLVRTHLMSLALDKRVIKADDIRKHVTDIVNLAIQISDLLKRLESADDFVTAPYIGNMNIVDVEKSAEPRGGTESNCLMMLQSILGLLDVHDPWAAAHAHRTSEYASALGTALCIRGSDLPRLERSALFHDIGKLSIPDAILQKPSQLTEAEQEIVRRHTETGYQLLRHFNFLDKEAEAAYAHHERHDGRGYPRGLAGDRIPLFARIVAIADAFDAIHCGRSYHGDIPAERVIDEINKGRGTQFDPAIVDVFLKVSSSPDSIFRRTT